MVKGEKTERKRRRKEGLKELREAMLPVPKKAETRTEGSEQGEKKAEQGKSKKGGVEGAQKKTETRTESE